jgi:hypothetical protein
MTRGGEVDVVFVLLMLEDIWRFWGWVSRVIARDLRVALAQVWVGLVVRLTYTSRNDASLRTAFTSRIS